MYHHPTGLILISIVLMLLCFKHNKVFILITTTYPILAAALLISSENIIIINLHKINFTINFSYENKLIGLAFIIITLVINLYANSQNRKFEVLIGSIYSASSLACLLAGDFISMFIFLELMMICASLLIFYGGDKNSIKAAKQYFLTHFFSGSLILIGISYIVVQTGNTQITELITNRNIPTIIINLILIGCLINVATVPFSGWMINCYPAASNSGLIYLITFTSKVSIMILIKLFSGLAALQFFGILMILYSGFYVLIETNLKKLLCYLTISQLGFMLCAIGANSQQVILGIISFLFIHIIYKALFGLYIIILVDQENIKDCFKIRGLHPLKQPLLFLSLILSVLTMISFPPLASFTTKTAVTNMLEHNINYYIILLLKLVICITIFSIVSKHKLWTSSVAPKLHLLIKASLFLIFIATFVTNVFLPEILTFMWPSYPREILNIVPLDLVKQAIIIILATILTLIFNKIPKCSTSNIDYDLFQIINNVLHYLDSKYKQEKDGQETDNHKDDQDLIIHKLEEAALHKIKSLHSQQTSIFMVLTLLIILIFTLNFK